MLDPTSAGAIIPDTLQDTAGPTVRRGNREEVCPVTPWTAVDQLQALVRGLGKREGCARLHREFPHRGHNWFARNFARLMQMSPADFAGEIGDHRFHGEALSPAEIRAGVSHG